MKKSDVQINATYLVKVAGNLVPVKITHEHDSGGWVGTSVKTGKTIRIKSAQRLRKRLADPASPKATPRQAPEHIKAVHKADQENARLDEQRAKAADGQTASERAMAESAPRAKKAGKATKDAKPKTKLDTGERDATGATVDGKPMSLLDAAAHLLSLGTGDPMRCKDIVRPGRRTAACGCPAPARRQPTRSMRPFSARSTPRATPAGSSRPIAASLP